MIGEIILLLFSSNPEDKIQSVSRRECLKLESFISSLESCV